MIFTLIYNCPCFWHNIIIFNLLFIFNNFLQYVMVILKGSLEISFAGSKEAAAYAEIVSMGGINSEVKKKLIATIGTILQSKLSIPRTRFFLKVYDTTAGRNYSKI
jgi:phenylpyruvate tautomerase